MSIARITSLVLAFVLVGGGILLSLESEGHPAPPTAGERPRPVRVERVAALTSGPQVRLSAVTRAADRRRVAFTVGGRLLERPVQAGDRVARGALLARLDPQPLEHAVQAAEAALAGLDARIRQARKDTARARTLAARGVLPTQQEEDASAGLQTLLAQRRALRAQRDEARRQRDEAVLRADWDGTVAAVLAEPGEVVAPGAPVLVLAGDGAVEVELEVPESLLGALQVGAGVTVDLPLVGRSGLTGTVRTVGAATTSGRLFPVVVALPADPLVRPGLTAEVVFATGHLAGLGVPVSAVVDPTGTQAAVLRVAAGRVERVPVDTGALVGDRVAVRGPLAEGDLVVVAGHAHLVARDAVVALQPVEVR